jgi:prepilin-type N-terminal cleavage/methylation domain-containing protein
MKVTDRKRGFSLIELMVAVAIITISIVTLVSVILTNMKLNEMSRELSIASNAANEQLEHWQGTGFNSVIVNLIDVQGSGTPKTYRTDFVVNGIKANDLPQTDPRADSFFTVLGNNQIGYVELSQDATLGDGQNFVRILIRVDWMGVDGQPRHFQVETRRSDRGINAVVNP